MSASEPEVCPDCGGARHDHAQCAGELRAAYMRRGLDVTVSTAAPIVRGQFTTDPFICPHGVRHWVEPTGEQLAKWTAERTP